jgi:putative ABC transport system permease protein
VLIPRLALASLRSRRLTTALTVTSIALSVTLLVGIEQVRAGVRDSFAGTIRGVDLIVGARGGTLQTLLSTVFGIGAPAGAVSLGTVQRWARHPAVKWAVPYSLGDSHRGFRVVGTTRDFFVQYRYRNNGRVTLAAGRLAYADTEVVVGSEVAERLRYAVGTPVVVTHGMVDIGTSGHEAHPFRVVGVLARTFTPIDRSIYVTLEGIAAMHEEGGEASPPAAVATAAPPAPPAGTPPAMPGASPPPTLVMPGASPPPTLVMPGAAPPPTLAMPGAAPPPAVAASPAQGDQPVSAFFVGTKNRFEALMLQREMNTDRAEPLTAVIPGVALGELWQNIGAAEVGLRVVAVFAVAIGLMGMLVALYTSLEGRRREMAILRAVGAGPRTIVALLVLESALLAALGCALGVGLVYALLALAQGPLEQRTGIHLALRALGATEWRYLALVLGAGGLIGFIPARKAYRTSLADGLSPRA